MPFAIAEDGTRLWYELEGAGPPLVLHLGAGCDSSLWRAAGYVEPLSRAYRCILLDHRGHGRSDHPAGAKANPIDRFVDDLGTLLDELGIDEAAFWGYSNGMVVELRAAELWLGRIRTLVMSGTVWNATPEQVTAEGHRNL